MLDPLDERDQLQLYLMLAEKAAFLGNIPLTEFAAAKGEHLSQPQSPERIRAELYGASAAVVGENPDGALEKLKKMTEGALDDEGRWAARGRFGGCDRGDTAARGQ